MAEILRRLVPMLTSLGVEARWEVLAGDQEFFDATKRISNSLQGQEQSFTEQMSQTYLKINNRNAQVLNLDADLVMVHDPEPAALIEHRKGGNGSGAAIWIFHSLSAVPGVSFAILLSAMTRPSSPSHGFAQRLPIPKFLIYPSIDPLSEKNREMSRVEVNRMMDRLGIPRDKPILLQVARFDRFKDPVGTIAAYRMVKKHFDCRLILAGGGVANDPDGEAVVADVRTAVGRDSDIHVLQLPPEADGEINALQQSRHYCPPEIH